MSFIGKALGGLFGGAPKPPSLPPLPPAPAVPTKAAVEATPGATEEEARKRAAAAQGRAGTILTSPLGDGTSQGRRTILGG
jgi:hypothetical protein